MLEATRDNICINHIINQKKENFIVEGDSIIPDIKPDIINTIFASGNVCIYKKEVNEGKIKLDGCVNTYIIYQADDENNSTRSLNVNLDFSQIINVDDAKPDMNLETNVGLKKVECKIINGRKINLKAFLEVDIKLTSNEEIKIVKEINSKEIQMLNEDLNLNSLVGKGVVKTYAKDTIIIDNIDNLSEVMKVDLDILNKDIKVSYNKVLAKADLNVKMLYLTEDNRINSVESIIPVMSFIDMENVTEENNFDTKYEIKNIIIKPNNVEEHSIYVEVELEIACEVYKKQNINLIQDLYSPKTEITFTQKQIQLMQKKERKQSTCNIREKQLVPEIGANKLYDVETSVNIIKQTILNEKILYEGELNLVYIYNEKNGINIKKQTIPFNFNIDFKGVNQNSNISTSAEVVMQDFVVLTDGEIEVKVDVNFTVTLIENIKINIIDDINEETNKDMRLHSLVIYYVKKGDTLWKIAKKFKSTVEEIARINGIEDKDKIDVGMQLYIPRYNG